MSEPIPSKVQVWKLASRPHTLTASVVPVIVGYASTLQLIQRNFDLLPQQPPGSCTAAAEYGGADEGVCVNSSYYAILPLAFQFAIFAGLIQISTNLHNDYADFVKGADTDERVGHARATQKGWLTPYETCRGCVMCLISALWVGMHYLIPINKKCLESSDVGILENYDPIMIFIVLSSLFNAVAYTGGPFPLGYVGLGNVSIGYSGLGDLFVFIYFGVVATMGAPYLYLTKVACLSPTSQMLMQRQKLRQLLYPSFLHSVPIGFLATAIIVVNNLRDRHTDIHAGKRTMAVRFGAAFAKMEYLLLVLGSYGFCIYFWSLERGKYHEDGSPGGMTTRTKHLALLPLLSLPMAISQLKAVAFGGKDGQSLNEHVGGTAKLQMFFCLLMTAGLVISSLVT
ncbi:hypothetical protein ACHAXR_003007 [Thalassiosira sp. AJA248-18]